MMSFLYWKLCRQESARILVSIVSYSPYEMNHVWFIHVPDTASSSLTSSYSLKKTGAQTSYSSKWNWTSGAHQVIQYEWFVFHKTVCHLSSNGDTEFEVLSDTYEIEVPKGWLKYVKGGVPSGGYISKGLYKYGVLVCFISFVHTCPIYLFIIIGMGLGWAGSIIHAQACWIIKWLEQSGASCWTWSSCSGKWICAEF